MILLKYPPELGVLPWQYCVASYIYIMHYQTGENYCSFNYISIHNLDQYQERIARHNNVRKALSAWQREFLIMKMQWMRLSRSSKPYMAQMRSWVLPQIPRLGDETETSRIVTNWVTKIFLKASAINSGIIRGLLGHFDIMISIS